MRVSSGSLLKLRLTNAGSVILFLAVVGVLMWLSQQYHARLDWTAAGRHSLSEASAAVLERLDQPIAVTAFMRSGDEARTLAKDLIARYQRVYPEMTLVFVNPDTNPTRTREAGIVSERALLIEYGKGSERVQQFTEESLTNALARLVRGQERNIAFLTGHGERRPDRQGNHDLSSWATQMTKRGLRAVTLRLGADAAALEQASVLVIASPSTRLLAGELKQIRSYVAGGGNLLWLHDPDSDTGLESLAEQLGVEFEPGVVVDPASQLLTGASADFIVVANYGTHPIVRGLDSESLYPAAAAMRVAPPEGWRATPILDTLPTAWSETGLMQKEIRFDEGKDIGGPLDIAFALTRDHEDREQRIVIIGDGDFVSNTFVANGGNLDLAMNLINWVGHDDAYIDMPSRIAADVDLNLSRTWQLIISFGFLIVLPLALVGIGVTGWWWRRKR